MAMAILCGFGAAAVAPFLHRLARPWTGVLLSLVPFGLLAGFSTLWPRIAAGETLSETHSWMPGSDLQLTLHLDALSYIFVLLITGIGGFVALYAGEYLKGHPQLGRFYLFLLSFMASMLGLVLSDNLIALFVFWELTSVTSYLLIGFDHEKASSRSAALQGLLITVGGGQALLVGFLLLGSVAGHFEISGMGELRASLHDHAAYLPILLCVLAGAFTKSAQFPLHFWLPGAMAAPTPVSAYLHSATMVKAGVYLLARLSPTLAGSPTWTWLVGGAGAATMLVGAYIALGERDLKRMLAFATVSVLGMLTFLLGIGTAPAVQAALVFLVAHALYKGALFLVAGSIDHATGTRDVTVLGGLRRAMPVTFASALLAAVAMAGLLPAFGFIGKELVYEAALRAPWLPVLLAVASTVTFVPLVAVAATVAIRPFFGALRQTPNSPHEAPVAMWAGPACLGVLGMGMGLHPAVLEGVLSEAAGRVFPGAPQLSLHLWHGLNAALGLSGVSLVVGVGVYLAGDHIRSLFARLQLHRWSGDRAFDRGLLVLNGVASWQTRVIQSGYLPRYVGITLLAIASLTAYALITRAGAWPVIDFSDLYVHEAVIAVMVLLAAFAAAVSNSRLASVAAMGVVGFGVALIFLFFGAPDLALTQAIVEALTVVVFLLALFHLPRYADLSSKLTRGRDLLLSLGFGGLMTALVLFATKERAASLISGFFLEKSVSEAHGRNVVNVILVDFRALDTLGEITVLAVAGLGVLGLLRERTRGEEGAMTSVIFNAVVRALQPLLLFFSIFLLLSGHNDPGGGFSGGLVAASAFVLHAIAQNPASARRGLHIPLKPLVGLGLLVAFAAAVLPVFRGKPFFTSLWLTVEVGELGELVLGSPLLFDIGVYLVVMGVTLMFVLPLAEEE